jgi:hypothetical protein
MAAPPSKQTSLLFFTLSMFAQTTVWGNGVLLSRRGHGEGLTKAFLPFGLLYGSSIALERIKALLVGGWNDFGYFHKSI